MLKAAKKVAGERHWPGVRLRPGLDLKDAIRFARAVEPSTWRGSKTLSPATTRPIPRPQFFKQLTESTSTPIHTGEEIYLRENFKELIETQAVNVLGPDPEDVGGIAELKWIAEYADLHGILVAPHGIFDGLFGVAAQVHLGAAMPRRTTLPSNTPKRSRTGGATSWMGLPDPIVKNGFIEVWDNRAWVSPSTSKPRRPTWQTRIGAFSTKHGFK